MRHFEKPLVSIRQISVASVSLRLVFVFVWVMSSSSTIIGMVPSLSSAPLAFGERAFDVGDEDASTRVAIEAGRNVRRRCQVRPVTIDATLFLDAHCLSSTAML